ncbi:MAG: efflux transporter outer membrane subunit [Steroidobacteraceae bacterium]|nr:efflux transporter outer membrane subunit [Steroidobacteraceae bacterium]
MGVAFASRLSLVITLANLAGCVSIKGPPVPNLPIPVAFTSPVERAHPWPSVDWWVAFGSPQLCRLIHEAQVKNPDIRTAAAQFAAADANLLVAGASRQPAFAVGGGGVDEKIGKQAIEASSPLGGLNAKSLPSMDSYLHVYSLSFSASYEIDFWGKNLDKRRAAIANADASRFNRDSVALSVEALIADTYFQILADQEQITIARREVVTARRALTKAQDEYAAGTVDRSGVAQAQAAVAADRAALSQMRQNAREATLSLATLVGVAPEDLPAIRGGLDSLKVPPIAPGNPAGLLARRPDVAQARALLEAAGADVAGAKAQALPSITLTGATGWQSTALSSLFEPQSILQNAVASMTQPLFEGGLLLGGYRESQAIFREDVARYQQSWIQALTDVEQQLTALHETTDEEAAYAQAVASARTNFDVANANFERGTVDVGSVTNAEQALLSEQSLRVQANLARFVAAANLFKAMGGGWISQPTVEK